MKKEAIVLAKKIRSLDIWNLQLLREFCTLPDSARRSSVQTVKPLKAWYIKPLPFWVYQSTKEV